MSYRRTSLYILLVVLSLFNPYKVLSQKKSNTLILENTIIAHRGMPYHAPEETAPSYWLAKKLGADYLEADLQRTKDGIIICLHDDNLQRTTNIGEVYPDRTHLPVSSFTLAEIKKLDAGNWFNNTYPKQARNSYVGLSIISLDELIEIAEADNGQVGLYLETKNPALFPGIEKQLYEQLDKRDWVNNPDKKLILQTFSTKSLKLLHTFFPTTPKCMLLWNDEEFLLGGITPDKLKKALLFGKTYGAQIVGPSINGDLSNYDNLMKDWMIDLYHNMKYTIHAYTFDTTNDIDKFTPLSDGQFTNRTDLLLDYYERNHKTINKILTDLTY